MPGVIILGATGYVGRRVVDVLVQSGQHRVYGVARNTDKAKQLELSEVVPIICSDPVNDPANLINAIRENHIDVVVDVAGANDGSFQFLNTVKTLGQERLDRYHQNGLKRAPKLGFVYCSGTWVHGSSDVPVNDLVPAHNSAPTPPCPLVAWRAEMENAVLGASEVLDVAIIRPALIYGRESTIWTPFIRPLLQAARNGASATIQVPLSLDSHPGLIHVDDVAAGFKCAVEKLPLINSPPVYPVFDLVTSQESMKGVFDALVKTWRLQAKVELVGPSDDLFAGAMSASLRGSSDRAKHILGWEPKRLSGFISDMETFARAFASQYGQE